MGFSARDFVHGANAVKSKKLRSWAADEAKLHFLRNKKYVKIIEKEMLKNPPGPRLTETLRLLGSEPNRAPKKRAKN